MVLGFLISLFQIHRNEEKENDLLIKIQLKSTAEVLATDN